MASAQTLLIISDDKDFSSPLAEHVKRELALTCVIAETVPEATRLAASAALIVTTQTEAEPYPCPVIPIKNPPIRLPQLLADIAAQLQKPMGDTVTLAQRYSLQLRQKQLTHHSSGKMVDLTDKEAQLLHSLAMAGSSGIAKDQLLKDVWGFESALDTHTLETHIYRLRGKFKELAGEEMIEAMNGGYALISERKTHGY